MALKVCNQGENILLTILVANWSGYTIHLYQNDYTPIDTDTNSSYTECNFSGYSSVSLSGWSSPATNGAGKSESDATQVSFTRSGTGSPQTAFGYYVTNGSSNLVWAERLSVSAVFVYDQDTLKINPVFSLSTEF